jgi:hypothetical protein
VELASLLRPLGLAAGPAAALALVLMLAALLTAGDAVDTSPLATAASAVLLLALLALAATALCAVARLRAGGHRAVGATIATLGTVFVAGGGWATLFVLPALAAEAPGVLDSGLPSVEIGFIASYVVFTVGWVWAGIELARARVVPTWLGVLVAVAGVLAFAPAPEAFRLLVVGIAATLLTRALTAGVERRVPQPA